MEGRGRGGEVEGRGVGEDRACVAAIPCEEQIMTGNYY